MVRIESDGTPAGTKVLNDADGSEIVGIENVEFSHRAGAPPLAKLRLWSSARMKGAGEFLVADPNDGGKPKAVASITFADGSKFTPPK